MQKKTFGYFLVLAMTLFLVSGCSQKLSTENILDTKSSESISESVSVQEKIDVTKPAQENSGEQEKNPSEEPKEASVIEGELIKGNVVTFGTYEQDNNIENGSEPIEWIVIGEEEAKALLLSKYCLDEHMFHDEFTEVKWEDCELRRYLNDEFLNKAFDAKAQEYLLESNLSNKARPDVFSEDAGNDTLDAVFCLSYDECLLYLDLFTTPENSNDLYRYGKDLLCEPTLYATTQGVFGFGPGAMADENLAQENAAIFGYTGEEIVTPHARWWLRTSGKDLTFAMIVDEYGEIAESQYVSLAPDSAIQTLHTGIRPAVWVKKD